jgi:hypothetical protein
MATKETNNSHSSTPTKGTDTTGKPSSKLLVTSDAGKISL